MWTISMWIADLPPFLPFYLLALVLWVSPAALIPHGIRVGLMLSFNLYGGLNLWMTHELGKGLGWQLLHFELWIVRMDKLSLLFGYLFHVAAFIALVYALKVRSRLQQVCGLFYIGSALGAVFAGDLLTLVLFWEGLALSSAGFIFARPGNWRAGQRYLIYQVLSGVLLFAGALGLYAHTGSLAFTHIGLPDQGSPLWLASWLIFIAFGIKSAFPLLHSWLTDGYPRATVTGTVFLSAFTTKVAIYALARGFAGTELLVPIGVMMACFPIFYAVIENDLRKVLAYSLINQLGFMVVGIGLGSELGLNGAVAHAFADVIFKGLLFMSMGAVLLRVGHVNGSDLGGLYRSMPRTTVLCVVGAASISAFPLFSGFVSKSMIMTAMIEAGYDWAWLAMLFASAGVFHHAGIKIPYFAFFAHDRGLKVAEAPGNMLLAMGLAAILCIGIGSFPEYLYALLPYQNSYWPYDLTHTLTQLQLLFFSALAFVWLNKIGWYPPELRSINLDADWFYRRLVPLGFIRLCSRLAQMRHGLHNGFSRLIVLCYQWPHRQHFSTAQLTQRLLLSLAVLLIMGSVVLLT